MESMAGFLKDLPCHNRLNFQHLDCGTGTLTSNSRQFSMKQPPVFIQTKDYPEEQVLITTEKTNILLRYLQQQLDKKNKKREAQKEGTDDMQIKRPKLTKAADH